MHMYRRCVLNFPDRGEQGDLSREFKEHKC